MPPYWRNRWRRRTWRRRRRPRIWRPRRYFRPRLWRPRRRVRRRFKNFLRYRLKRKLLKKYLVQWQPETINKCRIKGQKCLFQAGFHRLSHNFYEYFGSYVPTLQPGGGGWGLMVFSLDSLYEDFNLLQNYWTKSNAGLPLCTYQGCKLRFYQTEYTDYLIKIDRCWPMVDTPLTHANSHPQRMLLDKKTIKVPSLRTKRRKKPYKQIWVKPPQQMQNKWYFQQDLSNTKLLMVTATACDLINPYIAAKALSNNISLLMLNTNFFQNHNFQTPSATTGYQPKNNIFMYAATRQSSENPQTRQELIYLGNTKDNQPGKPMPRNAGEQYKIEDWGNPFWHSYLHEETYIFTSQHPPTTITDAQIQQKSGFQRMTEPYFIETTYNPDRDTGLANVAYFVPNSQGTNWEEPGDENRKISGLPLWIMMWGWTDWIKKLHQLPHLEENWILCIKSTFFADKLPAYVMIDFTFKDGKGPYNTELSTFDSFHFHPRLQFQQQSNDTLACCGPGVARPPSDNAVQAKMTYQFYFKWGGCPRQLEKVYDPSQQIKWATPNQRLQGLQIKDPKTSPETYFYPWDTRYDYITKKGLERVKKYTETDETLLSIQTGCKSSPETLETLKEAEDQTSDSEEEKASLQQQLRHLRHRQQQLKQLLLTLTAPHLE
nr:MAG: ORF1 [TTV-like mini virus]